MIDKSTVVLIVTILGSIGTAIGVTVSRELDRLRSKQGILREIERQSKIKDKNSVAARLDGP